MANKKIYFIGSDHNGINLKMNQLKLDVVFKMLKLMQ